MEMFESKLEALMLSKAFEELSPEERAYVLEQITESTYINCRFILNYTVEAFHSEEKNLVPKAGIPARLKEHFEAKFQPVKATVFFNIFQPQTLYRSAAVLGMATAIIGFFIINRPGKEIDVQKPEHTIARITPIKIKEKPGKAEPRVLPSVNMKFKQPVKLATTKTEEDTLTTETPRLLGLHVYEPILCLEIELNEQVPGLNEMPLAN